MYTINGFGTTLYGRRDEHPDGSYICTKWFVLGYLPVFPLASYRALETSKESGVPIFSFGNTTKYKMIKVSLNRKQIFYTYLLVWGSLAILFSLFIYIVSNA